MKRRIFAGGILVVAIAMITSLVLFFFGHKLEVMSASTVMLNQPYHVHFSKAIDESSIKDREIFVTNSDGNPVDATLTLDAAKQSLTVENLMPGQYILHVEEPAFEKKSFNTKKQVIEFKVIEEIEKISSVQDLQDYFQTILNRESKNRSLAVEESRELETFSEASDKASADGEAGPSHSSTNNQVEDIEEGDIVATDGRYIYTILDNQIVITDATNPKLKVASKITLDANSYPTQLMIHNDMLIVIIDQYIETKKDDYVSGMTITKAAFYNVKNAENPKLIREIGQDGYMNGVRKYGNTLYRGLIFPK